eukprot:gnl/Chilomastix_cuspidata/1417.p1 GENE.gnl/Chilomastix_cuspidata/1417~~gnl/Chilomastix_cuspidata/1417.p1  ORF type:complete len:408 (+),score=186.41 gnl/Chilomastix_cuspidata/1417:1357-2580(+)
MSISLSNKDVILANEFSSFVSSRFGCFSSTEQVTPLQRYIYPVKFSRQTSAHMRDCSSSTSQPSSESPDYLPVHLFETEQPPRRTCAREPAQPWAVGVDERTRTQERAIQYTPLSLQNQGADPIIRNFPLLQSPTVLTETVSVDYAAAPSSAAVKKWTECEERLLIRETQKPFEYRRDWTSIAKAIATKNRLKCISHWQTKGRRLTRYLDEIVVMISNKAGEFRKLFERIDGFGVADLPHKEKIPKIAEFAAIHNHSFAKPIIRLILEDQEDIVKRRTKSPALNVRGAEPNLGFGFFAALFGVVVFPEGVPRNTFAWTPQELAIVVLLWNRLAEYSFETPRSIIEQIAYTIEKFRESERAARPSDGYKPKAGAKGKHSNEITMNHRPNPQLTKEIYVILRACCAFPE